MRLVGVMSGGILTATCEIGNPRITEGARGDWLVGAREDSNDGRSSARSHRIGTAKADAYCLPLLAHPGPTADRLPTPDPDGSHFLEPV